jgi:hypothetical protein
MRPKNALRSRAMNIENVSQQNSSASYYLMKNGFILRMEEEMDAQNIPLMIRANFVDAKDISVLNQDQANYRVAIFRDEILELPEYEERVFGLSH